MRTYKLPEDVRLLVRPSQEAKYLYATNKWLHKGDDVDIGEPEVMEYDNRNQTAVSCMYGGVQHWLLVAEIGLAVA